MGSSPLFSYALPAPDETEVAALLTVRRYLHRAGTQAGSRLLIGCSISESLTLIGAVREQVVAAHDLCNVLLSLPGCGRRRQERATNDARIDGGVPAGAGRDGGRGGAAVRRP